MGWLDHYLDPLLLSPIILYLYNIELNYIHSKNWIPLSNNQIIATTVIFCALSEFIFPLLSSNFTFDPMDIFAIIAGSLYFKLTLNDIQI
jgi:hypothetical protein